MSYYQMNIKGDIKLSDYSVIHDYISVVGIDDNFTIKLEASNSEDVRVLCNILETDKFNVVSKGGKESGSYFIQAFKKR